MKKLLFKTNINCGGCVSSVSNSLNQTKGIRDWTVDTGNPEKILAVETEALNSEDVISIIEKAGFKAETV